MNAERAGLMQMQLRHNADELQSYLEGLQNWEDEIKVKDKNLSKQKPILKEVHIISVIESGGIGEVGKEALAPPHTHKHLLK